MSGLTDTHCHLADPAFADVEAVLARAHRAGVDHVLAVGTDPRANETVLALARRHADVWPALGYHPERLDLGAEDVETVEAQLQAARAELRAVGEVGLPWYSLRGRGDAAALAAVGRERLRRLLDVARRLDLPVSLHAPHGAAVDALELVTRGGVERAVFHWHKADRAVTRRIVEAGHFVGITPAVVYRERDQALVRDVPLRHVLLESDGPWAHGGEFAGRVGEPAMLGPAAAAVARLVARPLAEVVAILADNVRRAFGAR